MTGRFVQKGANLWKMTYEIRRHLEENIISYEWKDLERKSWNDTERKFMIINLTRERKHWHQKRKLEKLGRK